MHDKSFKDAEPIRDKTKKVVAVLRRALRPLAPLARESRRDDGVIGLIIVIALLAAAAALIATTARQNKDAEVRRLSGNATSVKLLKNAVVAYFLTDPDGAGAVERNGRIPCPDTNVPPDGQSNINGTDCVLSDGSATGGTTLAYTGVVPWITMGLSESDATDAFGNYFTYAVTSSATSRAICTSVTNSYNSALVEYTGTLNDVTDTEARLSSQSAGQGTPYYYAFVSHGKNGLGAISASGARRSAPTSTSENQNCSATNTNCTSNDELVLITGPKDETTSTYFDDSVFLGSNSQLTELCESLTPAGAPGADLSEDFTQTDVGSLPPRLAAVTGTASVQQSTVTGNTADKVLRFTGANAAIQTATTSINSAERARYISFEWTPTTLGTSNTAGVSVGLRATAVDRGASTAGAAGTFNADIFNTGTTDGLTVRFFDDVTDNANGTTDNHIYICDNVSTPAANCNSGNNLASSGSDVFRISNNTAYSVEVYDDGVQIWARITQVGSTAATGTAIVQLTSIATAQQDFADTNRALAINYSDATVEIDDVLVGRGAMGVSFNGNDQVVSAGDNHDTTTGNLTLEAWIRPDTLPTGSNRQTLISKWTNSGANAAQSYRLYLTAGGALTLQLAGSDGSSPVLETHSFGGYAAKSGRWDHIAVTYNGTGSSDRSAKLYVNRELIARSSSTAFATNGIQQGTASFAIGAENDGAAVINEFDGDMTDVRVWNTARTALEVFANYNRRLPLIDGSASGLIVNWTLDRDTTATQLPIFGTAGEAILARPTATTTSGATGVNGTLSGGAAYVAISQRHIPVFASATMCAAGGAQGAVVGAFQCDYRLTTQTGTIAIPNSLASIHVKAWGGGGGGYDFGVATLESSGGGGGFSAARLLQLNTSSVAGQTYNIDIGGGGTASTTANYGSGGGAATGLWLDSVSDAAGVIGGGGGGASYGDDIHTTINCSASGQCGPGSGGGGPANIVGLSGVTTSRAVDNNRDLCGGRGGDNAPTTGANPPNAQCTLGGQMPTAANGGSGASLTVIGGLSAVGNGGAGYEGAATQIGGGGGGGGVSTSTLSAGGGTAGGYATTEVTAGPDTNHSGFGGGGGSGFADSSSKNIGFFGAAGAAPVAGAATDPNYAGNYERVVSGAFVSTAYCTANPTGNQCTNTPGRGGEPNVNTAGKPGAVILKW